MRQMYGEILSEDDFADSNFSDSNDKTNAKLIDAAPEMYEVLSFVENMLGYKSDLNQLTTDDLRVFRQVKDTLNKIRR